MTTYPHPHEAGPSSETPQLPGCEAPAVRVPVPRPEERIVRERAEQADRRAGDPVAVYVGHRDGPGGQAPPGAEQAGRLGERDVFQRANGLVARPAETTRAITRLETRQPRAWSHRPSSTASSLARRVQLIVDPRSGDGVALSFGRRLACHLRTDRYDVHLLSTDDLVRTREELLRTARALRCLIAIGGDDTISEMAAVAMELQVPLLPVPAGFGNIVARTFGYRATVPSVLELLERGTVRHIDAGRVERSVFLANHAFGFTEDVKRAVAAAPALPQQPLRRYLHYWRATARSLVGAPLPALGVEADGTRLADGAAMVLVANLPSYRGLLPLTPAASPFDGLLDVFTVPAMPKPRLVALLLAFLVRAPGRWRAVRCCRAARVRVTTAGRVQHDLRVLPGAVPVLLLPTAGSVSPRLQLAS
jgi:diacylglycerol kinase family enzyme